MKFKKERLLIIAPHADDEILGCYGLIKKVKDKTLFSEYANLKFLNSLIFFLYHFFWLLQYRWSPTPYPILI